MACAPVQKIATTIMQNIIGQGKRHYSVVIFPKGTRLHRHHIGIL
jgi:hypothetical protein